MVVVNGDPKKGETNTGALPREGQGPGRHLGRRVRRARHVTAYDMKTGKRVWRAYSMGPDTEMLVDPEKTTALGKPVGKDSSA